MLKESYIKFPNLKYNPIVHGISIYKIFDLKFYNFPPLVE